MFSSLVVQMAFEAKLGQELRLRQQLVMTPQLQQAIKILQLAVPELETVVQAELEQNPMLEMAEPAAAKSASKPHGTADQTSANGNDNGERARVPWAPRWTAASRDAGGRIARRRG